MYLHLGQEWIVKTRDIIGIFDIDNCSVSRITRDFFKRSEQADQVVNVSPELPKSFVLTSGKPKNLYISQISPATLKKRWEGFEESITDLNDR